jgi:hypothetical protein
MAILSKHGETIKIELIGSHKAYCEDGSVLINKGDGWKLKGKLKQGLDYRVQAEKAIKARDEKIKNNPTFANWRKLIMGYSLPERIKILLVFRLLGYDIDEIYSELNDYRLNCTLEEIKQLHQAYAESLKLKMTPKNS